MCLNYPQKNQAVLLPQMHPLVATSLYGASELGNI